LRFVEVVYKILVTEFNFKPLLTIQQFFSIGFAEVKVIFLTKIISLCQVKVTDIVGKRQKYFNKHPKDTKLKKLQSSTKNNDLGIDFQVERHEPKPVVIHAVPILSTDKTKLKGVDILDLTTDFDEISIVDNRQQNSTQQNSHEPESFLFVKNNSKEDVLVDSFIADKDILDLTEIEEIEDNKVNMKFNDNMEQRDNNDIVEEKNEKLPQFHVTKHLPEIKICGNNQPVEFIPNTNSPIVEKCKQCAQNETELINLKDRFSEMENNLKEVLNVNHNLSAKVLLLETNIKFLESTILSQDKKERSGDKQERSEHQIISNSIDNVSCPVDSRATENQSIRKSYSPLKYSDDEVIMKDFRPISMKDVRNAMSTVSNKYDTNKENVPDKFTDQLAKPVTVESSFSSFDTKTKETIFNVKQRLKDAEELLTPQNNAM